MDIKIIGIIVLWLCLYSYIIMASIDFGTGFYAYYAKWQKDERKLVTLLNRYLSPIWEVTNIFLIFFVIGMMGLFPDLTYYYGAALIVPGSVVFLLLAIRGSFYTFNYWKKSKVWSLLYASTGLLIPPSLATFLTISEGGFLQEEENQVIFLAEKLLHDKYSWSVVLLAIISVLFISAAFLTYYAKRVGDDDSAITLRKFAIFWGVPTIVCSLFVFNTLKIHNIVHFNGMEDISWMFTLSIVFFVMGMILIGVGKWYGIAFLFVMLQYFFAFFGYGIGHLPYIVYPFVTVDSGILNPVIQGIVVFMFLLGSLILLPTLYMLVKLLLNKKD